jgi:putative endonuclease
MTLTIGHQAEQLALDYLQSCGLRLLERNFRGRFGEIDLIMQEGKTLVFVEVRLRKSKGFGGAEASITSAKQNKLRLTASQYLQRYGEQACRFDTIFLDELNRQNIVWVKQAF